ncbi:putative reverse transcriptase domain-containing protein [Tanacetum coccineum]
MEDQPLPANASPTALSPGYIADFDPEEDEKDAEVDPADHLVDGGDNDDNESSDDDEDDDVVKDKEDKEEEEHLAPADPSAVLETMTIVNQGMSVEEIERVVAQRVANAIEAIAIYKTKTNMSLKFQKCVDMIHGGVRASKPKTMQDEIEFVTKLMDKKISTPAQRQDENKRKLDNTSKNNQKQQQPNKRQNTSRAYTTGHGEKKHYGGSKPLCSKCIYHHDGPCAPKCHKCNRVGHLARDRRSSINVNTANNQRGTRASQKAICYECGNQGHYRNDCPK